MVWGKTYLFGELFISLKVRQITPKMGAERAQDFVNIVSICC
jgi:hypothetical protein